MFFYESKARLQGWEQGIGETIRYELLEETGPEHFKQYRTGAYIGKKLIGTGEGRSKKLSEQQAAYDAITKIREKNRK